MRKDVTTFCLWLALLGDPNLAHAGRVSWMEKPYDYVVINQDLRDVLVEFGRNVHVPVVLSDRVRGAVRGDVRAKTAFDFLERVADGNGLAWYFDGSALQVSLSEESTTEIVNIGPLDGKVVVREMRRLNLMDDRFVLEVGANPSALRISGPPAFVAIVRQVIATIKPPSRVAGSDPGVRVFRGKHDAEIVSTSEVPVRSTVPRNAVSNSIQQSNASNNQED